MTLLVLPPVVERSSQQMNAKYQLHIELRPVIILLCITQGHGVIGNHLQDGLERFLKTLRAAILLVMEGPDAPELEFNVELYKCQIIIGYLYAAHANDPDELAWMEATDDLDHLYTHLAVLARRDYLESARLYFVHQQLDLLDRQLCA